MFAIAPLIVFALSCSFANCYFPNYILPCSQSSPEFLDCALEHGRHAIPYLVKGDKKLRLRPLDPLDIPEINIDTGGNLKLFLRDNKLYGLGNMDLRNMSINLEKRMMHLEMFNPNITIVGTYNITGQILILPITGNGLLKASLIKGRIGYTFTYDLVPRDGELYVKPLPPVVTLDAVTSSYYLENLFNGDKRLGDEMNKFLNENHEVMFKEISPSIKETISFIAQDIVQKVLGTVPYNQILLP